MNQRCLFRGEKIPWKRLRLDTRGHAPLPMINRSDRACVAVRDPNQGPRRRRELAFDIGQAESALLVVAVVILAFRLHPRAEACKNRHHARGRSELRLRHDSFLSYKRR
jgi:hypothetical protein